MRDFVVVDESACRAVKAFASNKAEVARLAFTIRECMLIAFERAFALFLMGFEVRCPRRDHQAVLARIAAFTEKHLSRMLVSVFE
jgi:hypothetical protein